ncbi:MAG: glutaredoxin family protein, partial [Steroidobacteraceae bacterium]
MQLVLLSRPGCGLCEEMREQLALLGERVALPPLEVLDVDSDAGLARRYGLKIPVLLLDGVAVCFARLDERELLRHL